MISRCCMRRRVKAGLGTLMGIKDRNLGEDINSVANRRRRASCKTTLPKARKKSSKPQYRTTPNFQKRLKKYCAVLKNVVSNSKKRDGEQKMSLSAEQDKQCHGYEDYEEEIDNLYRCAPCNQPSELHIRSAFRNLGKAVLYSHQSIEEKRKKIERELADDSRITKHRFHL